MDNREELFPWVEPDGTVIGSITRGEAHGGSMKLHPVVHLHLFDSDGRLYLQKRPSWKDIQPGRWDTACGGHVDFGEDVRDALVREVREELGITEFSPQYVTSYVFESSRECELVNVFTATFDGPVCPSAAELDGGRFWTLAEIEASMGKDVFTPNFEGEYRRIVSRLGMADGSGR